MPLKICKKGHKFERSSTCLVCPICSVREINEKYCNEFPKISAPAFRALDSIRIKYLSDLTEYSEKDLLALHGFGPKALKLLQQKLQEKGLSFKK